jgi:hypothetical protein
LNGFFWKENKLKLLNPPIIGFQNFKKQTLVTELLFVETKKKDQRCPSDDFRVSFLLPSDGVLS